MKHCAICDRTLPLESFPKNKTKRDGLQTYCRHCKSVYQAKWYQENKQAHKKTVRKRAVRLHSEFSEFKKSLRCSKCGEDHPATLDFHHIDPSQKEGQLRHMYLNFGKKKFEEELAKCIVLCANCHRKHHWTGMV